MPPKCSPSAEPAHCWIPGGRDATRSGLDEELIGRAHRSGVHRLRACSRGPGHSERRQGASTLRADLPVGNGRRRGNSAADGAVSSGAVLGAGGCFQLLCRFQRMARGKAQIAGKGRLSRAGGLGRRDSHLSEQSGPGAAGRAATGGGARHGSCLHRVWHSGYAPGVLPR